MLREEKEDEFACEYAAKGIGEGGTGSHAIHMGHYPDQFPKFWRFQAKRAGGRIFEAAGRQRSQGPQTENENCRGTGDRDIVGRLQKKMIPTDAESSGNGDGGRRAGAMPPRTGGLVKEWGSSRGSGTSAATREGPTRKDQID